MSNNWKWGQLIQKEDFWGGLINKLIAVCMDGVQTSQQQFIIPLNKYDEQILPRGIWTICAWVKIMCEWMNGWIDGWIGWETIYVRGAHGQTHVSTLMHIHLYKVYFSSVYFIALQGSDRNTLAFNHSLALHEILLCFSGWQIRLCYIRNK